MYRNRNWFGNSSDFPGIADALGKRGFSGEEVGKIMGGNWVDLLTRVAQPGASRSEAIEDAA